MSDAAQASGVLSNAGVSGSGTGTDGAGITASRDALNFSGVPYLFLSAVVKSEKQRQHADDLYLLHLARRGRQPVRRGFRGLAHPDRHHCSAQYHGKRHREGGCAEEWIARLTRLSASGTCHISTGKTPRSKTARSTSCATRYTRLMGRPAAGKRRCCDICSRSIFLR